MNVKVGDIVVINNPNHDYNGKEARIISEINPYGWEGVYKLQLVEDPDKAFYADILTFSTLQTDTKEEEEGGTKEKEFDPVKKPSHYNQGGIEPIDFIEANNMGYYEGNIIKYITRYKYKGTPLLDLEKARHYLDRLIAKVEKERQKGVE